MPSGRKVEPPKTTWTSHPAGVNKIRCYHCKSHYAILTKVQNKSVYQCPRCRRIYSMPSANAPINRSS